MQAYGEFAEADGGGWDHGMADYDVAQDQQQAVGEEGIGFTPFRVSRCAHHGKDRSAAVLTRSAKSVLPELIVLVSSPSSAV